MSSKETEAPLPKERISAGRLMMGIIIGLIGFRLLWSLPLTRQAAILFLGSPEKVPLPTLTAPHSVRPETAADVQLLEHWGPGTFLSLAWSPAGRHFAIGTTLGINLYDGRTFQSLRFIDSPIRNIDRLVFSPDESVLAVTAEQRNILLFDLADGKILRQWEMEHPIVALSYLKDGTLVCVTDVSIAGTERELLKFVDEHWQLIKVLDDDFLLNVAFESKRQAFVVFYENSVRLVDPVSGVEETLPYTVPYDGSFVLTNETLFTVDRSRSLISAYKNGSLLNSTTFEQSIFDLLASPDGNLLAGVGRDPLSDDELASVITFWKAPELEQTHTMPIPETRSNLPGHIVFSPAADRLAFLVSDSVVKILSTIEGDEREIVIHDPLAGISDAAITREGDILALSCAGTTVSILKLPSEVLTDKWQFDEPTCGQLLGDAATVVVTPSNTDFRLYRTGDVDFFKKVDRGCCTSFSYDGNLGAIGYGIASSGDPVSVKIWNGRLGYSQTWNFYDLESDPFHVAVSPTGQYAAGTNRSTTYLWVHGIESGKRYPSLFHKMVFSPDEKYLASTYGILELKTGQITALERDEENLFYDSTPAFSPDGQILAAEDNRILYLWQVSNGALLAKLNDPYISTDKLVFSPDGTFLIGVGKGFINVWRISH